MAKQEWNLQGDGFALLEYLDKSVIQGSMSASLEDGCVYETNGVRCFLRVYERYSVIGSNRVSLSVMLLEHAGSLHLTAITSGGSQAVLFKLNTLGEESFLDALGDAVRRWQGESNATSQ